MEGMPSLPWVTTDSCAEVHAQLVFYNRVPKAGSTSMLEIIRVAASTNRFAHDHSADYSHYELNSTERKALVSKLLSRTPFGPRTFDRHVYYIDFPTAGAAKPDMVAYINLVREPVERFVSRYYYWQDMCPCQNPLPTHCVGATSVLRWSNTNAVTRLWASANSGDCVRDINKYVAANKADLPALTAYCELCQWFCGHEPLHVCDARVAARRVRDSYVSVGVLEELQLSLNVLARHQL